MPSRKIKKKKRSTRLPTRTPKKFQEEDQLWPCCSSSLTNCNTYSMILRTYFDNVMTWNKSLSLSPAVLIWSQAAPEGSSGRPCCLIYSGTLSSCVEILLVEIKGPREHPTSSGSSVSTCACVPCLYNSGALIAIKYWIITDNRGSKHQHHSHPFCHLHKRVHRGRPPSWWAGLLWRPP